LGDPFLSFAQGSRHAGKRPVRSTGSQRGAVGFGKDIEHDRSRLERHAMQDTCGDVGAFAGDIAAGPPSMVGATSPATTVPHCGPWECGGRVKS